MSAIAASDGQTSVSSGTAGDSAGGSRKLDSTHGTAATATISPASTVAQPRSSSASSSFPSKGSSHPHSGEGEFAIAADLTLYANPLRMLNKADGRPAAKHDTSGTGSDMIAADLVKYGSPLDDKP